MSEHIKIDVWSDIACPWCYIGKRRLEAGLEAYRAGGGALPVEVEYHSFQLAPELPVGDIDLGKQRDVLARRKGIDVERAEQMMRQVSEVAASVGLSYDMNAVRMTNTLGAHSLLHLAKTHGRQPEAVERLFAAYFSEGRHLGSVEELAALAAEIGLDGEEARKALEAGSYLDAVRADQEQAYRYGINGVPFYVVDGKYGISGAQGPELFQQALTTVQAERREEAA